MADPPDALRSSLADRYRIEREIGAGGMAMVFLAQDLRHGRAVALKVMRPDVAAAMGVERFQREVTLTATLQHPNILALFDSGESAGYLYYVTPYVDGESLREKLERERQLGVEEALDITRQVADALDYAHHRGVVHRDIKPANVLLAPYARAGRPHALVADFGIARALPTGGDAARGGPGTDTDHRLTQTGISLGTPTYMSPEQTMGDERVDGRSDVYSLACVVYEMLAGEPAFTGATVEALAVRKHQASPPLIAETRPSVPASVDAVIRRALVPVAADRYATAGEFSSALTDAFAAPGSAQPMPHREHGAATGARTPGRVLRAVALTVAVLAVIGVSTWSFASGRARSAVADGPRGTRDSVASVLYRQAHDEIDRRTEASVARGVALLQRALERDSNYADAWADLTRALVFAQNNRYDIPGIPAAQLAEYAVRASERALESDSLSATAWISRTSALYLIEPTVRRGAITAIRRAVHLDPGSADAWLLLGSHYEDILDGDSALLGFRRAVDIRPTHPQALAFLGLHYMWQRQPDSALVWADSASRSNPTHILSRQTRGLVLIQQGRVPEAEDDFTAIVSLGLGPERVWGWSGLAVIAWRRHDRRAVDSLTLRAIADADTLHPSHHEAVYLAWMYAEIGQRDRALAVLERFARPRHLHFQLHLRREFTLDSLRREPRFAALLRADSAQPGR